MNLYAFLLYLGICLVVVGIVFAVGHSAGRGRGLPEPDTIKECFNAMMWNDSGWQYGYVNISSLLKICK